ncbi:MAG: methyltransferase domain-containing protein [Planctomycetota bacterium]|nr:MAG: methyltransferase domain-containing protein [Planctomycetota bacterium]
MSRRRIIPATGLAWMLPWYDPLVRICTNERRFKQRMLDLANLNPAHRVIDVGCGTGTLALSALGRVPSLSVVAVDADPRMLRRAARKTPRDHSAVWLRADAEHLPLADHSFDRVFCSLLLHHLEDAAKRRAISEMRRLLKPGGKLILADYFHPASSWARLRFLIVRCVDGWQRTRFHVVGDIERLLREAQFHDIQHDAHQATLLGTLRIYRATA